MGGLPRPGGLAQTTHLPYFFGVLAVVAESGGVLGTFAIYYRTPRAPHPDEVEAINALAKRVAHAVSAHR